MKNKSGDKRNSSLSVLKIDALPELTKSIRDDNKKRGILVPWKNSFDVDGKSINDAAINALSARFDLPQDALASLSRCLYKNLNNKKIPSDAERRGASITRPAKNEPELISLAIERAVNQMAKAEKLFEELGLSPERQRESSELFFTLKHGISEELNVLRKLQEVSINLNKHPNYLVVERTDGRKTGDPFISMFLFYTFYCWRRCGKESSFTTEVATDTFKRSGPLLDFIDAIVAEVTDPPSKLERETVVRKLKLLIRKDRARMPKGS